MRGEPSPARGAGEFGKPAHALVVGNHGDASPARGDACREPLHIHGGGMRGEPSPARGGNEFRWPKLPDPTSDSAR